MSQNVALELRAVVRNYGKGAVVGPITAEVKQGEFISLLGPSGCGKTTMLRCIAGFESVDEGSVLVNGVDISRKPPHKRNIGLVFQSYALFPHLTVRENVRFGLRMQKLVPAAEADVQVRDALGVVGLSHLADRYPAQLSGGQQQRVAIARSVVLNPPLLLLDEPLSNLDFKLRVQMREELRSLQRRLGTTFVYVTHDQTEALAMSDRVVVLSQGKIAQIGTPREIYDNPASRFVADFIGASNLLKVVDSRPLGQKLEVSLENGCKMICRPGSDTGGGERWVSVRPENIKAVPEGVATQQDTNVFRVKVLSKTFCGDKFEIWARLQGAEENCDAGSNILMHVSPAHSVGESLLVKIDPEMGTLVGDPT